MSFDGWWSAGPLTCGTVAAVLCEGFTSSKMVLGLVDTVVVMIRLHHNKKVLEIG